MVLRGVLDELVAEGVITADQADTIRERIREVRGDDGGEGRARFREAMEQTVASAASTLGMEPADLVAGCGRARACVRSPRSGVWIAPARPGRP